MLPGSAREGLVLVTGGSRGIGAATALQCARAGWHVAINGRGDTPAARSVAQAVRGLGRQAFVVPADLGSEAGVLELFAALDEALAASGLPLVGLVNNAGIVDARAQLDEMGAARLQRMFAVNVIGAMLVAREALRRMSTRHGAGGGAIVNVSSVAATLGSPAQYVDYAASKGAIDTFTVGLARELAAEGVRVNAVRPGIIDTEIHASSGDADRARSIGPSLPMRRVGRADEVAAAIVWLLSDAASYVTGAILDVSGAR